MRPTQLLADQDAFNREQAEADVEAVITALGGGGDVTESITDGVVAYLTEEIIDREAIRLALEAKGYEVVAVYGCKWEVWQDDDDVPSSRACYDEDAIAVAFNVPELDPDEINSDHSGCDFDPDRLMSVTHGAEATPAAV